MLESSGEIQVCLRCRAENRGPPGPCAACGGRRIAKVPELFDLAIAHVDCDAFYASVEKRDDPSLEDRPVIVGGGRRGVVSAACYVARTYGVRSAMPMFKALKACPDAVVIRPDFDKYVAAGRAIRELMRAATPLVEPISIDEAFLDLAGTERVHGQPPAMTLARLADDIRAEVGVTVSVGLSGVKFLAKLASDLEKPSGFTVIPMAEAPERIAPLPVAKIWGVGAETEKKLRAAGLATIGDIQAADVSLLTRLCGAYGQRLFDLARGRDPRPVVTERAAKSVSCETTFSDDVADLNALRRRLWSLSEDVSRRMKDKELQGRVVVVKLRAADFETHTKRITLGSPTNFARTLFEAAEPLLAALFMAGERYRLIGVGFSGLSAAAPETQQDLFDAGGDARTESVAARARQEAAIDAVREKFGDGAIAPGRAGLDAKRSAAARDRRRTAARAERWDGSD